MANQERFFQHDGVRYRFLTWERNAAKAAPVVLLHGFAQSADSWDGVAGLLCRERSVVALDLVGHGGSDQPDDVAAYALEAQAEALLAFLAFVACGDSCALDAQGSGSLGASRAPSSKEAKKPGVKGPEPLVVGYSMGGRVALAAACRNPRAFGGLVLESVGLGPTDERERAASAERDARNAAALRNDGLDAFMDAWERLPLFASQRDLPKATRARLRAGRLDNDAEALALTFEGAGQHAMPNRETVLEALESLARGGASVLYLAGSHDEKYRSLAERLRDGGTCPVRIVEGAGHNVHLENPATYAHILEEFLARA